MSFLERMATLSAEVLTGGLANECSSFWEIVHDLDQIPAPVTCSSVPWEDLEGSWGASGGAVHEEWASFPWGGQVMSRPVGQVPTC